MGEENSKMGKKNASKRRKRKYGEDKKFGSGYRVVDIMVKASEEMSGGRIVKMRVEVGL